MMTQNLQTVMLKDIANKKLIVTREFAAAVEKVWAAFTQAELLDQWWAPKPWKTETKSMDFSEGGHWMYCMVGPDGSRHWCRMNYMSITATNSFSGDDCFCDEEGNRNTEFPSMNWKNNFRPSAVGTQVTIEINFEKEEDIAKILEMGMEQGIAMAHTNLDELLAQ